MPLIANNTISIKDLIYNFAVHSPIHSKIFTVYLLMCQVLFLSAICQTVYA